MQQVYNPIFRLGATFKFNIFTTLFLSVIVKTNSLNLLYNNSIKIFNKVELNNIKDTIQLVKYCPPL